MSPEEMENLDNIIDKFLDLLSSNKVIIFFCSVIIESFLSTFLISLTSFAKDLSIKSMLNNSGILISINQTGQKVFLRVEFGIGLTATFFLL
jgi:hypothetical protein